VCEGRQEQNKTDHRPSREEWKRSYVPAFIDQLIRAPIAQGKAAKVWPEPVGARSSVLSPRRMAGQALICGGDGFSKLFANHFEMGGRKAFSAACDALAGLFDFLPVFPMGRGPPHPENSYLPSILKRLSVE
jgi:hypothetical protein